MKRRSRSLARGLPDFGDITTCLHAAETKFQITKLSHSPLSHDAMGGGGGLEIRMLMAVRVGERDTRSSEVRGKEGKKNGKTQEDERKDS